MKMNLLSGGRLRMRKSVYFPDAERGETIEIPVSCAVLRHPQGNVLFDTGCHPSVPDDPEARWGSLAKLMVPIMPSGENVVTGLAGIGLQRDDIDIVVCSHLHPDHCGCNTLFKRASFIIHKKEIEAARAPNAKNAGYLAGEWEQSARSGKFFLASDAVSVLETIDRDVIPRNTWNVDALMKSLAEIKRIQKQGAVVLCGHDAAQWQSLRRGADAYD